MAKDLDEILKYASQDTLDINHDLIQNIQNRGANKIGKLQKYRNQPVEYDDRRFDSRAEAKHYQGLKALQDLEYIVNLECQPSFTLLEAFTDNEGEHVRAITYKADFKYFDRRDDFWYIVDVKSTPTSKEAAFRIRWKLLQHTFRNSKVFKLKLIIT